MDIDLKEELKKRDELLAGYLKQIEIQEEFIHVDVLPAELKLPRRYAFRYMEIEAIDTSLKWQLVVEDVSCTSVSAVRIEDVEPVKSDDEIFCFVLHDPEIQSEILRFLRQLYLMQVYLCKIIHRE